MKMEELRPTDKLEEFLESGIYDFEDINAFFIDPVRVLNRSYTSFRVSPSAYYSRFFESKQHSVSSTNNPRKRKRKQIKQYVLNEREQSANNRHQQVRSLLMEVHETLMGASELLGVIPKLRVDSSSSTLPKECEEVSVTGAENSLVELGKMWQAPLFDITLSFKQSNKPYDVEGKGVNQCSKDDEQVLPLFNYLVGNMTSNDAEAKALDKLYILPRESSFYMSDLGQIHNLIPADSASGYNLIIVDPPWENGSASQKAMYQTLPNRYFLSLPISQFVHKEGALLALWVTNREKLLTFVENELFPAWGVRHVATYYWLKIKPDGSLISELDLFHHKPYERLLLGYCSGEGIGSENQPKLTPIKDNGVILSIPGDYSRKPPIGRLLRGHAAGSKRVGVRCIELFAREMMSEGVAWGNEPLYFQNSKYFLPKH